MADRLRKTGPAEVRHEPYAPLGWGPPVPPVDPYEPPGPGAAAGDGEPAGYPPPATQAQYVPALPHTPETSSRAVVALVLAVSSFLVCPLLPAVVALFLAHGARVEVRQSGGRLTGDGLARAAAAVAWLNVALCLLVVVAVVALVASITT